MGVALSAPANADVADRPFFRAGAMVIVFAADDYLENGGVAPVIGDFLMLENSGQAGTDLIAGDMRPINYNTGRFNPINGDTAAGFEYRVSGQTFGGQFISGAPHQTLGVGDAFNAFGIDNDTDIVRANGGGRASRFFVASNVPFDIFAHATDLTATGSFSTLDYENIRFRFRVDTRGGGGANRWGNRAQHPGGAADPDDDTAGVLIGIQGGARATLDDISAAPTKIFQGVNRTAASRGTILEQAVGFQMRYNLRAAGADNRASEYDFSMGTGTLAADVTYTVYTP